MDEQPDYAALVSALMNDQKATAYEMAKRAGLTQQSVLNIAKGNRPNPQIETIRKLLVAAGKSWGWIDEWLASIAKEKTESPPAKKGKK